MAPVLTSQTVVVEQEELTPGQLTKRTALFNPDGTPYVADAELPATATALELSTGTEAGLRMVSPKLIHDEIARQIAAIPPA